MGLVYTRPLDLLGDHAKAGDMTDDIDWECLLCRLNIDQSWTRWHVFYSVVSECFPKEIVPFRNISLGSVLASVKPYEDEKCIAQSLCPLVTNTNSAETEL